MDHVQWMIEEFDKEEVQLFPSLLIAVFPPSASLTSHPMPFPPILTLPSPSLL